MHFYKENGEPFHYVPMTTRDGTRPTRMSDVLKVWDKGELCVPSVTTVLNILSKPALQNWKINQHLKQAYKIDKSVLSYELEHFVEIDEFIEEVKRLTEIEMDLAPSAGTNFHKLMEDYVNRNTKDDENYQLAEKVYKTILDKTSSKDFIAEKSFATELYGGSVDLHSNDWIIDYKTKQTKDKFKPGKMCFQDHSIQLSAYREGLGLHNAKCANVFVCLEDGQIDFHVHSEKELEKGKHLFHHALQIWYIRNRADHCQKR
jgi:hypothetical protein